jgi:hypothetical protein
MLIWFVIPTPPKKNEKRNYRQHPLGGHFVSLACLIFLNQHKIIFFCDAQHGRFKKTRFHLLEQGHFQIYFTQKPTLAEHESKYFICFKIFQKYF